MHARTDPTVKLPSAQTFYLTNSWHSRRFKRSPVEDGVANKLGRSLTGAGGMQSVCR